MPTEQKNTEKGSSGTAAGMQVSGEQIFSESDEQMRTRGISEQDVQDAFGSTSENDQTQASSSVAAKQTGEDLKSGASNLTDAASSAVQSAKATATQAFGQVQERASSAIDTQKQNLTEGLGSVADGIRQFTGGLGEQAEQNQLVGAVAKYGDTLARQVENISGYLDRRDLRGLTTDLQNFARRNPAVFVGGAFALGLFAARFLKAAPSSSRSTGDFTGLHAYSDASEENTKPRRKSGRKSAADDADNSGATVQ